MANEEDTTSGDSAGKTDLGVAWRGLWGAVTDPNNKTHVKLKDGAKTWLAGTMDYATGLVREDTPEEKRQKEEKLAREKREKDEAEKKKKEEADEAARRATAAAAANGNAAAKTDDKDKKPGDEKPKEEVNWLAKLMLKVMPQGAKDWAAAAAVPMITQGQNMIAALEAKGKKLKVSDDIGALIDCVTGDQITIIPKSVHDYAKVILETMGLGDNEEMVNALSVGFIGWARQQVSGFSFGMIKPAQGFNASASASMGGIMDMLKFGKDPKTLVALFGFASPESQVDPQLLKAVKEIFADELPQPGKIEEFFHGDQIDYGSFVRGYAEMGKYMVASGKWNIDPAKITDDLKDAADEVLKKSGLKETDIDGSLRDGLAIAALHGADVIKRSQEAQLAAAAPKPPQSTGPELDHH